MLPLHFILPHPNATRARNSAGQAHGLRRIPHKIEMRPVLPLYYDDEMLAGPLYTDTGRTAPGPVPSSLCYSD